MLLRTFSLSHPEELKKVDVYAFALIAFYIFFDTKPWEIENTDEIQDKVLQSERPLFPDSEENELKDLIQRCWHQDPRKRPTFDGIIEYLRNI